METGKILSDYCKFRIYYKNSKEKASRLTLSATSALVFLHEIRLSELSCILLRDIEPGNEIVDGQAIRRIIHVLHATQQFVFMSASQLFSKFLYSFLHLQFSSNP